MSHWCHWGRWVNVKSIQSRFWRDNGRNPKTGYIIREEGVLIVWKQQQAQEAPPQAKVIANISLVLNPKALDSYFYYPLPNHIIIFFAPLNEQRRTIFHHCISKINHSSGNRGIISKYLWINDWGNHKHALRMLILFLFSWMMGNKKKKKNDLNWKDLWAVEGPPIISWVGKTSEEKFRTSPAVQG